MADNLSSESSTSDMVSKIDALIADAKRRLHERREMYRAAGIDAAAITRFLESDKLSPEVREIVRRESEPWQQELENEISARVEAERATIFGARRMRSAMTRV